MKKGRPEGLPDMIKADWVGRNPTVIPTLPY